MEGLVAVPVVLRRGDQVDHLGAGGLDPRDGLGERDEVLILLHFEAGRKRPFAPVGLADRDERRCRRECLERRDEPAVRERRTDAEGRVVSRLDREVLGICLDHLDLLRRALAGDRDELRRALDARDPAAELAGQDPRGPALARSDVEDVRGRSEPEPLAEQADLLGARRVLDLVLRLGHRVPPGHRRPRRNSS